MKMEKRTIVKVRDLNKFYGKHHVLKDVSFDVYEKEIVGFIGPNGSGKSTTMKCLCNLIYPTSGEITICDFDLKTQTAKALEQQASLIESPGLYPTMSGYDNLKLFAMLKKVPKERFDELIEFTNLGKKIHVATGNYSMGMKQRLALAIVLLNKPKFIILDEPTNGLDPKGIMELRNTLKDLVEQEGVSILFSSHQLGEIEKLADRIICINKGEIISTPAKILETYSYIIHFDKGNKALEVCSNIDGILQTEKISENHYKLVFRDETVLSDVLMMCSQNQIRIFDITKESFEIESIYQEIYEGEL